MKNEIPINYEHYNVHTFAHWLCIPGKKYMGFLAISPLKCKKEPLKKKKKKTENRHQVGGNCYLVAILVLSVVDHGGGGGGGAHAHWRIGDNLICNHIYILVSTKRFWMVVSPPPPPPPPTKKSWIPTWLWPKLSKIPSKVTAMCLNLK